MSDWLPPEQRVVVTGIGAITPCGLDMPTTWNNVREGRSGIGQLTLFDNTDYAVDIAGEAWGFDPHNYMSRKQARRADRNVQFALAAASEAVRQADLKITPDNVYDIGVLIGSGAGGIWTYMEQQHILDQQGPRKVNPMLIPMIVIDSASVQVGIHFGVKGPNVGVATACSTSIDSVGLALETIRRGDAQVMITGGSEAAVHQLGIVGFDQLRALSHRNHDPQGASRPFDRDRDGFVVGEGAVVLVLESLAHARQRDARPLAEIRAYAATSDGLHPTAPDRDGSSASHCMQRVVEKARLSMQDIDYINAHATSTPVGDPIEVEAIRSAFGQHASQIAVSSTKSMTGHLLGGAGALATALVIHALRDGCLPPTINLENIDPTCQGIDHIANRARPASHVRIGLAPSYGFGGHNSCLLIERWDD